MSDEKQEISNGLNGGHSRKVALITGMFAYSLMKIFLLLCSVNANHYNYL